MRIFQKMVRFFLPTSLGCTTQINLEPAAQSTLTGYNINGVQFKKVESTTGQWEWVRDDDAMAYLAKREFHRRELYWALRSRILTDGEMEEVTQYGDDLNIEPMMPYNDSEKRRELNDALLQQFKLRAAAPCRRN